jgi:transcriptional regulator with XRE-family HTH domain
MATNQKTTEIDTLIGYNLRYIRLSRSETQKAVADYIGVTFQQVQKYEKGMSRISASNLFLIAKMLKVDIGEFYKDIYKRPTN